MEFDVIFVVLVYRNTEDLIEFIESVETKCQKYKIVIVNSFFDFNTMRIVEGIAEHYECDFINVENKGYSFGNHVGIKYVFDNYDFKKLIVSNPDIIIDRFDIEDLDDGNSIWAPVIVAKNGKWQNPMMVKRSKLSERLIYKGFVNNSKILFYFGIIINKIYRLLFLFVFKKKIKKIYMPHGSFIVFSRESLEKLNRKPFDENIFLFAEESVLAMKAKENGINVIFTPTIKVFHKEDGSMNIAKINVNSELAKANIYYYENYVNKKVNKNEKK